MMNLMELGPTRRSLRTVSGPKGSSTKEYTPGAVGVPSSIFLQMGRIYFTNGGNTLDNATSP